MPRAQTTTHPASRRMPRVHTKPKPGKHVANRNITKPRNHPSGIPHISQRLTHTDSTPDNLVDDRQSKPRDLPSGVPHNKP